MSKPVVLVAEDLEDDFILLERAFRRTNIQALLSWAKHGGEAQDYLSGSGIYADRRAHPLPALVLLDIKMPVLNGFDLLRWIRGRDWLRRLPVVVLTSSSEEVDIDRAYDLGANSYLVKPTGFGDLSGVARTLQGYWLTLNRPPNILAST